MYDKIKTSMTRCCMRIMTSFMSKRNMFNEKFNDYDLHIDDLKETYIYHLKCVHNVQLLLGTQEKSVVYTKNGNFNKHNIYKCFFFKSLRGVY